MDYDSIHGPGISNFSSPSPHRLPTVSAAQALQDLKSSPTRCISTGLKNLDAVLQNRDPNALDPATEPLFGGVSRGRITEIYGPPGVGKTALMMQLAASVLHAGEGVVWVDASHPLSGLRFSHILSSFQPQNTQSSSPKPSSLSDLLPNLTHFSTPTLAHLIALLSTTTSTYPPKNTSLVIIESLPTLIASAFPRSLDPNSTPRKPGAPNPSARKFPILQNLISSLQKLAATRNLAVVITSQCVTKMRPGLGAVLIPAIQIAAWEQGLGCRLALFRDWGWEDENATRGREDDVRLARVIKAEGLIVPDAMVKLVGFSIQESGIVPLVLPTTPSLFEERTLQTTIAPSIPQKRKTPPVDHDAEIPDSDEDDEDYGWAEEDEEDLPPLPPQWQGSEDVLNPIGEGEEVEEERDEELDFADPEERRDAKEDGGNTETNTELVVDDSEDELAL